MKTVSILFSQGMKFLDGSRTFHLLSLMLSILQDKRFNKFYDTENEIDRMDS